MAVKAQDSVTVYDFNDISKVRTWYKLVPRTSSAPTVAANATEAQMTSNGWTTTEPAVDTAKKLYTVQQNIFGDGSYVWGEVSLSSSYEAAIQAYNKASAAEGAANETAKYFWFNSTDSGAGEGAGAHITEKTKAAFIADPANGGGNVLIDSDSVDVRDGTKVLATFGANGVRIGQESNSKTRSVISTDGMRIVQRDSGGNDTVIANFGYNETQDAGGTVQTIVHYTFGKRQSNVAGNWSFAEGTEVDATGSCSHAEGEYTIASDSDSHAEGRSTEASGPYSHAEGIGTIASGDASHAEGTNNTTASGYSDHAEGHGTNASGGYGAHAEGKNTFAEGEASHAEGRTTRATGDYSHAEGEVTKAEGIGSHAEGYYSVASGDYSHAQNIETVARGKAQTVIGTYNKNDGSTTTTHPSGDASYAKYAFILGNGTSTSSRSNALTVDWGGNVEAAGEITGATVDVPISVSRSTGTLVSAKAYRYGKIVNLQVTVYNTASVAAGGNIFVGQIDTTKLIPAAVASGSSYWGSHSVGGTISTAGQIVVRNASPTAYATSASQPINMSFMYLVD